MVLLELLGNLDLDLIDILENYTEIDEYLYSYHGYDNYICYDDDKKIGIELEYDDVDLSSFLELLEYGIINCSKYNGNDTNINASSDGSLSCYGVEFVTGARNIKKTLNELEDLLYYLEAETNSETGMHIHFDKSDWFYDSEENICKFIAVCSMWQRCLFYISHRHRDGWNSWSKQNYTYKSEAENSIDELYIDNESHRVLVNLEHEETVEYRGFKSTMNYELLESRVYFIAELINFTNNLTATEAKKICYDKKYSNKKLTEFLNNFKVSDNETEVIEELILNDPIITIKKQSCLINNVKKEEFIKDIFRPVRSY